MKMNNDSTRPKKSFGQNFLVRGGAVDRIVAALDVAPGEPVLEIGPGRGALTGSLIRATGRIAAVEIDRDLARDLRRTFDEGQLHLFEGDVLELALQSVLDALGHGEGRLIVAGNLPYNISKPVAQKLIRERERISRAVLMFQREVALRLTAKPGGRDYGPLTVLAGRTYRIRRLFDLPPGAFRPAPKVDSTVTLWHPRDDAPLGAEDEARLRSCLAVCFARRRRTLRNNLLVHSGDASRVESLLEEAGLDGGLRAEVLTEADFLRLATLWPWKTEAT